MARTRGGGGGLKSQRDKQKKEQQQHGSGSNNSLVETDQQQRKMNSNNNNNSLSDNDGGSVQRNSFSESLTTSLHNNQRQQRQQRSTTPRELKGHGTKTTTKSNVFKQLVQHSAHLQAFRFLGEECMQMRVLHEGKATAQRQRTRKYQTARMHLFEFVNWYIENDCQLNTAQIVRLGAHVYSSVDSSLLDHLCMSRFWSWIVQLYPIWLAPNLITLIGLIINLITVLVLSNFCYSAKENAPSWAYALAALGLFLYQTLDATDGKQARRTQSSSPLGELFDHGCDSMTQVFVTLNICYAMQLGSHRHLVFVTMLVSLGLFYTAHWSTYCTGQLRFSKFDVTEAQMTVIGILIATSLFGPGVWGIQIFGFQLNILCMFISLLCSVWRFAGYLKVILNDGVGKNGSTVAGTSVIYPLFPLLAVGVPFLMIYYKTYSGVYDQNITIFCLCFGAVAAKATNRLIIAHMSKSELELWDWIYLSPFVMILNQYYDYLLDEYILLLAATVYAYASLIIFCIFICKQFCAFLGISCFRIDVQRHRRIPSAEGGGKKAVHKAE